MSTKPGTVVEFLSGRQCSITQGLSAAQTLDRSFSGLDVAALTFYQSGEFTPQERRYRQPTLGGQYTDLTESLLVEREGNVSNRRHEQTCNT